MSNEGGIPPEVKRCIELRMEYYDNLPREWRDKLKCSPALFEGAFITDDGRGVDLSAITPPKRRPRR